MSLILEALKKSEANRRLGEAPDLATPFATPRRRRNPLPVLFVLIVAASAGGWWLLRTPPASEAPRTPALAATPPSAPAQPAVATAPAPAAAPAVTAAPKKAPDAFVAQAPQAGNPAAGNAPVPIPTPKPPPAPVAPVPKAPIAAAPPAPAPVTTSKPPQPAPVAAAPAPPASAPSVVASGEGQRKSEKSAPPAPPPLTVPTYGQLSFATRKDLPALKLNMHVYSADAAARFVLLNGAHLGEGDKQDDLIVHEIRPDGIIFEFHGQRFFFPRDGY